MGLVLEIEKYNSRNLYRREKIQFNNQYYFFGELLLKFIYADYSDLIKKLYNELNKFKHKFKNILQEIIKGYEYDFLKFFSNMIDIISEESLYTDPYLLLLKYELYTMSFNISSNKHINDIFLQIEFKLKSFVNSQDFYYEAINTCFNQSHKVLKKWSINDRIYLYYHYPINVLKHFTNNTNFAEKYIPKNNIKSINKNMFNTINDAPDNNLITCSPSTDVISRKIQVKYNEIEKKIEKNWSKNYNVFIPPNFIKEDILQNWSEDYTIFLPKKNEKEDIVKVIEFNSFIALCNFEFNKLIEYNEHFFIKECALCQKLFTTTKENAVYCNNIFPQYNKICSDDIGKQIVQKMNITENKEDLYTKTNELYKKLCRRIDGRQSSKDKIASKCLYTTKHLYEDKKINLNQFKLLIDFFYILKPNQFSKETFETVCIKNSINFNFFEKCFINEK